MSLRRSTSTHAVLRSSSLLLLPLLLTTSLLLSPTAAQSTTTSSSPPAAISYAPATTSSAPSTFTSPANNSTATTSAAAAGNSTAPATVSVFPGAGYFQYVGCYNETTNIPDVGVRALSPNDMEGTDDMTPTQCLSFCGGQQYAGLEYGRECWCGQYLNALSVRLPDDQCNFACSGDNSEACGGGLKLTLYNRSAVIKQGDAARTASGALGLGAVLGAGMAAAALAAL